MASGQKETVAATPGTEPAAAGAPVPTLRVEAGTTVGRYVVISQVGVGGFGMVFAAYDPELDRRVALKLMHRDVKKTATARLQREAQALARISHPNVVAVHDVGLHGGRLFVAMEFIAGQTLREWIAGGPHTWRETLRIFRAAGEGLAAAHAEGLVHRDFKPDNVMIGADGRVRVMDFGLARRAEDSVSGTEPSGSDPAQPPSITRTGAILGTPLYMAPEQFANEEVTDRSDQFSFCVALYFALYGDRPFKGESMAELARAVSEEVPVAPGVAARVPTWLRDVVLKGLARDPEHRHRSMNVLLARLRAGDPRRRLRRALAGAAGVGLAVGGAIGLQTWGEARSARRCDEASRAIDTAWNDAVRTRVHEALVATGHANARMVADETTALLDRQAEAWRQVSADACRSATIDGTMSAQKRAAVEWCLDVFRVQLPVITETLTSGDQHVVNAATELSAAAFYPEQCLENDQPPPPRSNRDAVLEGLAGLQRSRNALATLRTEESAALARRERERGDELGFARLSTMAAAAEADALNQMGKTAEAEAIWVEVYMRSARSDDWLEAARAATQLTSIVGHSLSRTGEGLLWAELGAMAIDHSGDPDGLAMAGLLKMRGNVHYNADDLAQARADYERVLELYTEALGPEHPDVAGALNNIGIVLDELREFDEAKAHYHRAIEIRRKAHGADHPKVAVLLNNLAATHASLREYGEAMKLFEEVLRIRHAIYGETHPSVVTAHDNLGVSLGGLRRFDAAREHFHRALSLAQTAGHGRTAGAASVHLHVGRFELRLGHHDVAREHLEAARDIYTAVYGPEHPKLGHVLTFLGSAQSELGRLELAEDTLQLALKIRENADGPQHPNLLYPLVHLGETLERAGDRDAAAQHLTRAVSLPADEAIPPGALAGARYALGRVLWDLDRDRARAVELVLDARRTLTTDRDASPYEGEHKAVLASIETWLKTHTI